MGIVATGIIFFILGAVFHAGAMAWYDRIKGVGLAKLHEKLDEIRARL